MSTSTATRRSRPQTAAARARRTRTLRRRLGFLAAVAIAAVAVAAVIAPWADDAVQEVALPLRHDDIIRQQASEKGLDPALIAGVIYAESHFRDQTSVRRREGPDAADAQHRRLHRRRSRAAPRSCRATSPRRR